MDEQPRLTDLIPIRWSLIALALLGGLVIIAGFEGLYAWSQQLAPRTQDGCIAAFDLDAEGSLAAWFSSTILLLAGLVALIVYSVRRHRVDDYQGYYRVWIWAALVCFLMSVDEGSSLHEGFKEMMTLVTGTRLMGDGSLWWVVPYFFLLGAVGTRLLVEMRPCRLSSAALMGTAACFAVAVLGQLDWIMAHQGAREVMVEEGAEMVGDLLLLVAMVLHARHVILEAQGLLPVRKPKTVAPAKGKSEPSAKKASKAAADEEESKEHDSTSDANNSITVHPPHGLPRPSVPIVTPIIPPKPQTPPSRSGLSTSSVTAGAADSYGSSTNRKMTKAERKAMRKRLEQMRAEREDRLGR